VLVLGPWSLVVGRWSLVCSVLCESDQPLHYYTLTNKK
jgi:hypothetical protein